MYKVILVDDKKSASENLQLRMEVARNEFLKMNSG